MLVAVEGPIFVANLAEGLADGFSLESSLLHALGYTAVLLFFTGAAHLRLLPPSHGNMTQAFILGCGCTFIYRKGLSYPDRLVGLCFPSHASHRHPQLANRMDRRSLSLSPSSWLAASVILSLEYFRRKTTLARIMVIVFGLLLLLSSYLPWKPVFAIESRLSPKPGAAAAINLAFDPTLGQYNPPSGLNASQEPGQGNNNENNARAFLFLPLRITGMGNDAILLADRVDVLAICLTKIVASSTTAPEEASRCGARARNPAKNPHTSNFPFRGRSMTKSATGNSRSGSTIRSRSSASTGRFLFAALNGEGRTPDWGWCQSKMKTTAEPPRDASLHEAG